VTKTRQGNPLGETRGEMVEQLARDVARAEGIPVGEARSRVRADMRRMQDRAFQDKRTTQIEHLTNPRGVPMHGVTNRHGLTLGDWLTAAGYPPSAPLAPAQDAWRRGDDPSRFAATRKANPVPVAPSAEEAARLAALSDEALRAVYASTQNEELAATDSKRRDAANRRVCWYLWEAQRRHLHLDRSPPRPSSKEKPMRSSNPVLVPSADEQRVEDLTLYADTTGELYPLKERILGGLRRKMMNGEYDAQKAIGEWRQWFYKAAARYEKEFKRNPDRNVFTHSDIEQAARNTEENTRHEMERGEHDGFVTQGNRQMNPVDMSLPGGYLLKWYGASGVAPHQTRTVVRHRHESEDDLLLREIKSFGKDGEILEMSDDKGYSRRVRIKKAGGRVGFEPAPKRDVKPTKGGKAAGRKANPTQTAVAMRLEFLKPNQAYVFLFGDTPTRLSDEDMFFMKRDQAVDAAKRHGLQVHKDGRVEVIDARLENPVGTVNHSMGTPVTLSPPAAAGGDYAVRHWVDNTIIGVYYTPKKAEAERVATHLRGIHHGHPHKDAKRFNKEIHSHPRAINPANTSRYGHCAVCGQELFRREVSDPWRHVSGRDPHAPIPASADAATPQRAANPKGKHLDVVLGEMDTVFLDGVPIGTVGDGNVSLTDGPGGTMVLTLRHGDTLYMGDAPYGRPAAFHMRRGTAKGRKDNPVGTKNSAMGSRVTVTPRKNEYGEYVVRTWEHGKLIGVYYTSDKDDAEGTASHIRGATHGHPHPDVPSGILGEHHQAEGRHANPVGMTNKAMGTRVTVPAKPEKNGEFVVRRWEHGVLVGVYYTPDQNDAEAKGHYLRGVHHGHPHAGAKAFVGEVQGPRQANPAVKKAKIVAISMNRYRASAAEKRLHGGNAITEFSVHFEGAPVEQWKRVKGYGPTPGQRKTDAIRRSGLLEQEAPPAPAVSDKKGALNWNNKLNEADKAMIRKIVGNAHVEVPEADIVESMAKRIKKAGGAQAINTRMGRELIEVALDAHYKNYRDYVKLMQHRELPKQRPSKGLCLVHGDCLANPELGRQCLRNALTGHPGKKPRALPPHQHAVPMLPAAGESARSGNPTVKPWQY